jgi:hypothetical protein
MKLFLVFTGWNCNTKYSTISLFFRIGLVILYFLKFPSYAFSDFLRFFLKENRLITSLGSLCLLANVVFFTIYINTNRDETAKGIFAITLIYGIGILLLKILN